MQKSSNLLCTVVFLQDFTEQPTKKQQKPTKSYKNLVKTYNFTIFRSFLYSVDYIFPCSYMHLGRFRSPFERRKTNSAAPAPNIQNLLLFFKKLLLLFVVKKCKFDFWKKSAGLRSRQALARLSLAKKKLTKCFFVVKKCQSQFLIFVPARQFFEKIQ